jgi:hypothetical protein
MAPKIFMIVPSVFCILSQWFYTFAYYYLELTNSCHAVLILSGGNIHMNVISISDIYLPASSFCRWLLNLYKICADLFTEMSLDTHNFIETLFGFT